MAIDLGLNALLLDVKTLAEMLAVSRSTIWRLESAGKIPAGLKIGGSKRWRATEISAWVSAGCPSRTDWELQLAAGEARANGRR